MTSGYTYYRIKLHNLTDEQKQRIKELSDLSRFSYNWALEFWNKYYDETGKAPGVFDIDKAFAKLRNSPGYEWLLQYNITTPRYAFRHLACGFRKFFRKISNHPHFHSKKEHGIRFSFRAEKMSFHGNHNEYISIPGICKFKDNLIYCGNHNIPIRDKRTDYNNGVIKFDGMDYWLTISVKTYEPFDVDAEFKRTVHSGEPLGIDLGFRTPAALSDGTLYNNPYVSKISRLYNRIRVIQSAIGRDRSRRLKESARTRTKFVDIPKSKNELKRETRFRKTHIQIHNIYNTLYHNISKDIVRKDPSFVVMEGFNIEELVSTNPIPNFRRAIYQARMGTLRSYIAYKCEQQDIPVIYADDEFPSTQLCSRCGTLHEVHEEKTYICPNCGLVIDRDLNAAINLRNYGYQYNSTDR